MEVLRKVVFFIKNQYPMVLGVITVVILGIGTGWFLSPKGGGGNSGLSSSISVGENEAGILDESSFKGDTAEGTLKEEGINGEGTHHLEREGGKSQTVYLASTAIDLQAFVDKKVKVWGESQAVKKAGWFMDVVKIKVIE
ncbi:MAG: hypothetical protein UU32_C0011G0009 [Candidatus Woesebacteria bacterium GW2011_GWB1_41_10]|uniref:Uncharacterized protein n=1 Tax=Candidatus Woesebacteria bacterium GW2011_GWB1_41_10 TaxID=1618577 RepID=A0A0G0UCT7_9BACT|nr:MAG: hypothetical protein UU32_C0011G0009 [Candidatus Woesebacteria bacterium GW2011_GWB1_41_10]